MLAHGFGNGQKITPDLARLSQTSSPRKPSQTPHPPPRRQVPRAHSAGCRFFVHVQQVRVDLIQRFRRRTGGCRVIIQVIIVDGRIIHARPVRLVHLLQMANAFRRQASIIRARLFWPRSAARCLVQSFRERVIAMSVVNHICTWTRFSASTVSRVSAIAASGNLIQGFRDRYAEGTRYSGFRHVR